MLTTKHVIIATEGKAEGGGVRKDLFHKHGLGAIHGRMQKMITIGTDRHYIKQAVQVGNGVPREFQCGNQSSVVYYIYTSVYSTIYVSYAYPA